MITHKRWYTYEDNNKISCNNSVNYCFLSAITSGENYKRTVHDSIYNSNCFLLWHSVLKKWQGVTMWSSIIVAVLSLIGTFVGSYSGFKLTEYRVQQLEKRVAEHNNFARRLPVVEEQIKVINHRLTDLEVKEK